MNLSPPPDWLTDRIINRALRTPYEHLPGYMERYWLLPPGKVPGLAARVHHILRSDTEREFHDHPWNYTTWILRGGYIETTPVFDNSRFYRQDVSTVYTAGAVLRRKARHWHRLTLLPDSNTTWTLFITGRLRQRWGFLMQPEFKMYWRDRLAQRGDYLSTNSSEGHHDDGTLAHRGRGE